MSYTQAELDNHSNQLNPNNDAYWTSRGFTERPDDWDDAESDSGDAFLDDYDWDYEPWCSDDFE